MANSYFHEAYSKKETRLNELPEYICIEISLRCNLKCVMCPMDHFDKTMKNRKPAIMSLETFEKILDQISDRPRTLLLSVFGEPLLHPRLVDFVQAAKKRDHTVTLVTNGTKLTKKLAKELLDSKLDKVTFSIDGYKEETYESIRKGSNYKTVIENLKYFSRLNRQYGNIAIIDINYVVSGKTGSEKEKFFNSYKSYVSNIFFVPEHDWGGYLHLPGAPGNQKSTRKSKYVRRYPCLFLWTIFHITVEGNAILCCNDFQMRSGLPGIRNKSCLDIWDNDIKKYREMHVKNRISAEPCRSCHHYTTTGTDYRNSRLKNLLKEFYRKVRYVPLKVRLFLAGNESCLPFGRIAFPSRRSRVSGYLQVMGWALADRGQKVKKVDVRLGTDTLGEAVYGHFRPDIKVTFPAYTESEFSAFFYAQDISAIPDGWYDLNVVVSDHRGNQRQVDNRKIRICNK